MGKPRILSKSGLRLLVVVVTLGLAGLAVVQPGLAQQQGTTVNGTVFEDKDKDGERDGDEKGIANVSVSDGQQTVRTDKKGNYSLTVDPERRLEDIVFVSVPSGYGVPADQYKTPQHYRQLGMLKPGEKRRQDFGLLRTPESAKSNFNFANLADVHVRPGGNNYRERFIGQMAQVNELTSKPAFVQVSGDLTDYATDTEFQDYKAGTATSRVPVYPAIGNHEYRPGPDYRTRISNYRRHLGPEWYSFDYGKRHFVVLDNNTAGWGEPDQLQWLRKDLELNARGKEVVVITHKPMNTPQTVSGTKEYVELLGKYNTVLALMGHTHVNDVALDTIPGAKHVVTNSSSYTIDQTPNGFRQVSFKGGKEENPFKMYDVKQQLTITNPAPNSQVERDDEVRVQVNAYNTSSKVTDVRYRVDGGEWKKMKQSSDFTWSGEWEAEETALGEHTIQVRATDDARKSWEESSKFRVVKRGSLVDPKGGANWSMFHANAQHTGAGPDALSPELNLAWSYRTPGTILTSSPAIVDGAVYVGTRDENGAKDNSVQSVDLKDGKKRWQFKTNAQVQASPAVADGIVYASSVRGTLYALDTRNGKKLWEKSIGQSEDGLHRGWMYYSPTVANGVVYQAYSTGKGGALMALDAKTGNQLWNSPLAGGWISESSPVVDNDRVYVGGDGGWLIALEARTGKELWRKRPAGGWMHSMPAIADGRLYMGYGGGQLVTLDAATGNELWRYKSPDPSYIPGQTTGSSPAIAGGTVYMGFPDGNVTALDAVTGAKKWSYRTGGGIISSAAVSGETIYIGSNDGNLYAFNRETGEKRWNYEVGTWVASSPAISGNTLVVGAFDGNLYAFTPKK